MDANAISDTIISFDIMSKGMFGSLVVAGIMALLTVVMTKVFSKKKKNANQ